MSKTKRMIAALSTLAAMMSGCQSGPGEPLLASEPTAASQPAHLQSAPRASSPASEASNVSQNGVPTITLEESPYLAGRADQAVARFGQMSCAQAFASSYGDLVGLDEETAMNLASGFGLGMGQKETCGAVTMMLAIAGLDGQGNKCGNLIEAFENEMGSTICQDFLDEFGYGNCPNCLRCAARLLETEVFSDVPYEPALAAVLTESGTEN